MLPFLLTILLYGFLALLCWIIYRPALHGPFIYDDLAILGGSPGQYLDPNCKLLSPWALLFQRVRYVLTGVLTGSRQGAWDIVRSRPLVVFTYDLDACLHGMNPRGWHRTSILLHWMTTLILHQILLRWFHPLPSAIGAVLFAAHPLGTMAVGYIAGRSSVLCGLGVLGAVLGTLDGHWFGVLVCGLFAVLAKEEALVLLPLLGAVLWCRLYGGMRL